MSSFETVHHSATAAERRAEPRHKALKGAHIAFNGGFSALECLVKDLSAHGARLVFGDAAAVPPHFRLTFRADGVRREATVMWRDRGLVGVALS